MTGYNGSTGPQLYKCDCGTSFKYLNSANRHYSDKPLRCLKKGRNKRQHPQTFFTKEELSRLYSKPSDKPDILGGFDDAREAYRIKHGTQPTRS